MIDARDAFSPSYARARARFLEVARAAGAELEAHAHPMRGRDGEELAVDVARDGASGASRLLVVSSAVHGVEGFCGSGVQTFALADERLRAHARSKGVTVLHVHATNPYGFAHTRRVTQENVDLNRNFRDHAVPPPANDGYVALHPLLLPERWPPGVRNTARLLWQRVRLGKREMQQAVSSGQYERPDGLFYGGVEPTWSNTTMRAIARAHARGAAHVAWIDLHTGLGPKGFGERILSANDDPRGAAAARAIWGAEVKALFEGSSVSARLTGMMVAAMREECADARFDAITIEYGTRPIREVLDALRGDHWLHLHPGAPDALARAIRRRTLEAFFVDEDRWKEAIVDQARAAMTQAIDALGAR